MARKQLSVQGRVVAAGVTVAVAAGLGGFMAARDQTAVASQPSSSSANTNANTNATTFPDDQRGSSVDPGEFQPQPQTRTGGS